MSAAASDLLQKYITADQGLEEYAEAIKKGAASPEEEVRIRTTILLDRLNKVKPHVDLTKQVISIANENGYYASDTDILLMFLREQDPPANSGWWWWPKFLPW